MSRQTPIRWEASREGRGWVSTNTADLLRIEAHGDTWRLSVNGDLSFSPFALFADAEKFANARFPVFCTRAAGCDECTEKRAVPAARVHPFRGNWTTCLALVGTCLLLSAVPFGIGVGAAACPQVAIPVGAVGWSLIAAHYAFSLNTWRLDYHRRRNAGCKTNFNP